MDSKFCILQGPVGNTFWTPDTGEYGEYKVLATGLTEQEARTFFEHAPIWADEQEEDVLLRFDTARLGPVWLCRDGMEYLVYHKCLWRRFGTASQALACLEDHAVGLVHKVWD